MPLVELPFAEGLYEDSDAFLARNRCLNFFPYTPDGLGASTKALRTTPGINQQYASGTYTSDPCVAAVGTEDAAYFINGSSGSFDLIEMALTGQLGSSPQLTTTNRGTMAHVSATKILDTTSGRDHVVILADGGRAWAYNRATNALDEIQATDANFVTNGNPIACTYLDSYYIFATDEDKIIVSSVNNPLAYNALDFASAEMDPDSISCVFRWRNQLHVGGSKTIEQFNNIGGADFPFERTGMFYNYGVNSPRALVEHSTGVYFIGREGGGASKVYVLNDSGVQKISTKGIEYRLRNVDVEDDLTSFSDYQVSAYHHSYLGHEFIVFLFPATCVVYDITEGAWHERGAPDTLGPDDAYRAKYCVNLRGWGFVGDAQDGRYGRFETGASIGSGDEYGVDPLRTVEVPYLTNKLQPFSVAAIELATTYSNDTIDFAMDARSAVTGDYTPARTISGDTNARYVWRRLGQFDRWTSFRFETTSPGDYSIVSIVADISG